VTYDVVLTVAVEERDDDMPMKNPAHPGRIIRDALTAMELSDTDAATMLNVSRRSLSTLLNGHSGITPEIADRLSNTIGSTPAFWLRLQAQYDRANGEQRAE
jgi:addiction module HigA family antidote